MKRPAWMMVALLSGLSAPTWAGQPPTESKLVAQYCANAQTQAEMNACAGAAEKAADRDLNATYKAALSKWSAHPVLTGKLRAAQRSWLTYRDADIAARFATEDGEGAGRGSAYPAAHAFYAASLARERTERLCEFLRGAAYGERDDTSCADLVHHPKPVPAGSGASNAN